MWRPETAGCSITTSQSGCRPTTDTGFVSSYSACTAPSRLTTMRAAMALSGLAQRASGAVARGAHEVADAAHARHAQRDFVRGLDFVFAVEEPGERNDAVARLDRDFRRGGARIAAQRRPHAPLEAEALGAANRF